MIRIAFRTPGSPPPCSATPTRARKHEAAAALRLVARDGDVLWSTTQESLGATFISAVSELDRGRELA